jgi:hypothetical protein
MEDKLIPVGWNELFGGALDVTIHRCISSALACNSMLLPFEGAAAERPN